MDFFHSSQKSWDWEGFPKIMGLGRIIRYSWDALIICKRRSTSSVPMTVHGTFPLLTTTAHPWLLWIKYLGFQIWVWGRRYQDTDPPIKALIIHGARWSLGGRTGGQWQYLSSPRDMATSINFDGTDAAYMVLETTRNCSASKYFMLLYKTKAFHKTTGSRALSTLFRLQGRPIWPIGLAFVDQVNKLPNGLTRPIPIPKQVKLDDNKHSLSSPWTWNDLQEATNFFHLFTSAHSHISKACKF
jgi:hypothetical protein